VGLWGKSQGGWVVALTASRSHDVAFLITLSGPAVSPWQQELYRVEHQLRTQGFSEDVIKDALTFMRLKFDVGRMGKDWGKLEAMMHDMHGETWFRLTNPPESLEDLRWFWDHQFAFEPVPVLENITAPMLALFGEVDTFLNVRESVTILEQTSRKKKNDSTIIVFPQADHSLFVATGQGWPQFVPGFLDTMTNWLLKRVDVND
jgi:pimeloyl-ACP methyl ester carboxylesterase